MDFLTGVGIFIATVLLIEGGYFALQSLLRPDLRRVRSRLRTFSTGGNGTETLDITRKKLFSEVPWLNRLLLNVRWTHKINRLLEQAGTRRPLGFFVLLTLVLPFAGYLGASLITTESLALIFWAAAFGVIPLLYICIKKKGRIQKFQRQLPEALELIARALRAGNAFSGSLKMVADEFDDPIGPEFGKTLDEVNFGVGVNEALKNLASRADCVDLKFFVISVIIQKETGGNLAEILENIASLIRERFKLRGHVKALAAEGKISAITLVALPFVVGFIYYLLNPEYMTILFTDPIGKMMITFGIFMMVLGILVMRRMIEIKI